MASFESKLSVTEKEALRKTLKELSIVRAWKGISYLLLEWTLIVTAIYFCQKYFSIPLYLLTICFIGIRQHAIAVIAHDGAHYRLHNSRKWNNLITNFFVSYPLFFQFEVYRLNHLLHHQYTNGAKDPDYIHQKDLYDFQFPMTKTKLLLIFLYDLFGGGIYENIKRLRRYSVESDFKKAVATEIAENKPKRIGFYIALAAALSLFGGWMLFFMYWIVPVFMILPAILRFRNICEHYGVSRESELTGSRDVVSGPIESWLFGPYSIRLHLAHHLYPSVPFYNLPEFHRFLMSLPEYRDGSHRNKSYLFPMKNSVMQDLTTRNA